jgi:tetraacyldisaccharide 4'-kinase
MKVLRVLLFPLAVVFDIVTGIRNRLYDQGLKPTAKFDLPVIGVGNLAIGGTGKTPMVEHLIRLLTPSYKVATLSRGYGRSSRGIRIANDTDTAVTLGDEPFQFFKKFRGQVVVSVGEERALAIPYIIDQHPETQVILLDDSYQHRKVTPGFQILLTDYNNPFYDDLLLPAGRLRESKRGINRADAIVLTKCPPEISDEEMISVESHIRTYSIRPVFFTTIRYGSLVPFDNRAVPGNVFVLVSGIASHKPFENYIKSQYQLLKHFVYNDHHSYTDQDVQDICEFARQHNASVLTTEKDAVKLNSNKFSTFLSAIPFFYLPIEMEFLKSGKDFDEMILNAVNRAS